MKKLTSILLAVALVVAPLKAAAQQFNNIPSGTVIGRTQSGTGPAQAIPFATLVASMFASSPTIPTLNTSSILFAGSSSGTATLRAQAAAATPTIQLPTVSGTLVDQATAPLVLSAAGVMSCPTCSTTLYASRAAAAALDLSALSAIRTLGYATQSDGGGASFIKVAAGTALTDTFVNCNPCTLVGGSSYTNGTYNGVPLAGGSGQTCIGQVVVAGGVVTQVNFAVPCVTHKIGDPLTTANTSIGGTGSGFLYTVTSVSTPKGSFTDAAGNLWQYVSDGSPNVLQFGCVGDWNGNDAFATNNTNCIWSATAFASLPIASASASVFGNRIWFPRGSYMTCGNGQFLSSLYNFPIPAGVTFAGMGFGASSLRQCAADPSGTHYISLCDSYMSVGEFGCKIKDITVDCSAITSGTSGIACVYSNAGQQFALAENVNINAGFKSCIKYEIGRGGAANDIWLGINCVQTDAATNAAFLFNAASVQHILRNSVCASSPNGGATSCISNLAGRLVVDGLDVEGFVTGLAHTNTTSGNIGVYRNVQQNSVSCAQAISIIAGSGGNMLFENVATSCPITILNGLSGGTNFTGNIVKPIICVNSAVCS